MQDARINIFNTPFSRYGAYLSVTAEDGRLVIHNSRLRFQEGALFAVTAGRGGEQAAWEVSASPWEGRLKAEAARRPSISGTTAPSFSGAGGWTWILR